MTLRSEIQTIKAEADERIGQLTQRLNDCGPKGNRSVEMQLDYQRGRSQALGEVLDMMERAEVTI